MKGAGLQERAGAFVKKLGKLRYPLLILLLGVVLLLVPGKGADTKQDVEEIDVLERQKGRELSIEEDRLSRLLSQVEGAGKVEVMLSLASGGETVYQSDTSSTVLTGEERESRLEESTLLFDQDSNTQSPLIRKENAPVYQGALILCQGANDPAVKLALIQAVAGLTGLGSDRITVVKMH